MNKEIISDKQGISLVILFTIGSSSVFTMGLHAKQDLWLALILGLLASIPFAILSARLHTLFPNRNLFDIFEICFGEFIGKVFILFFTLLNLYWSGYILSNYKFFVGTVTLPETPMIVTTIFLGSLCGYAAKKGIEVLGRWSEIFIIIPVILLIFSIFALAPKMNLDHLQPVLGDGFNPVFKGAFSVFGFPLGQIFATFPLIFSNFKNTHSPYKIYVFGLCIGFVILFSISVINILVLGTNESIRLYYPTYIVFQKVNVGEFVQRIEIILAITFFVGGFVKITISMLCVCIGIKKLFNLNDYRFIVIPICLLVIETSNILYPSVMYFSYFTKEIWPMVLFPIQSIFPIILIIIAEIKSRSDKNKHSKG